MKYNLDEFEPVIQCAMELALGGVMCNTERICSRLGEMFNADVVGILKLVRSESEVLGETVALVRRSGDSVSVPSLQRATLAVLCRKKSPNNVYRQNRGRTVISIRQTASRCLLALVVHRKSKMILRRTAAYIHLINSVVATRVYEDQNFCVQNEPISASPRLQQVLGGLLNGLSEKEIAGRLVISQHTVHEHVKKLYRREHVHSRAELLSKLLQRPALSIVESRAYNRAAESNNQIPRDTIQSSFQSVASGDPISSTGRFEPDLISSNNHSFGKKMHTPLELKQVVSGFKIRHRRKLSRVGGLRQTSSAKLSANRKTEIDLFDR